LTHTGMPAVTTCKSIPSATLICSDTANSYQKEESEIWIGEWLAKRGEQYTRRETDLYANI
jgi:aryl-alcohol dehydrogenase-like predicted oxidoreductase